MQRNNLLANAQTTLESLLREQLHALTIGDTVLARDLADRVALTQEALGVAEKLIASTSGVDPNAISTNLSAPDLIGCVTEIGDVCRVTEIGDVRRVTEIEDVCRVAEIGDVRRVTEIEDVCRVAEIGDVRREKTQIRRSLGTMYLYCIKPQVRSTCWPMA
jgi:hypothetical protein